jgi:hypothetical protein
MPLRMLTLRLPASCRRWSPNDQYGRTQAPVPRVAGYRGVVRGAVSCAGPARIVEVVNETHLEMWTIEGQHVKTQRLSLEQGPRDILALMDRVVERHLVRCPRCGFDVIAGDRLGPRPGVRYLRENPPGVSHGGPAAAATDRALSKLADAGVTRLTLSALGRILSW